MVHSIIESHVLGSIQLSSTSEKNKRSSEDNADISSGTNRPDWNNGLFVRSAAIFDRAEESFSITQNEICGPIGKTETLAHTRAKLINTPTGCWNLSMLSFWRTRSDCADICSTRERMKVVCKQSSIVVKGSLWRVDGSPVLVWPFISNTESSLETWAGLILGSQSCSLRDMRALVRSDFASSSMLQPLMSR